MSANLADTTVAGPEPGPGTSGGRPLPPAAEPRGAGSIGVLGPVLAVLTIGLAVVLGRDALVAWGVVGGTAWLAGAADAAQGYRPDSVAAVIGVVAVVVGLLLVVAGLGRRPRRAVRVAGEGGQWMPLGDVARYASARAKDVPGVLGATSVVTRRGVRVRITTTGGADITADVEAVLTDRLAAFAPPLRLTLRDTAESGSRQGEGGGR